MRAAKLAAGESWAGLSTEEVSSAAMGDERASDRVHACIAGQRQLLRKRR